ncbi:MAG TPA: lysylphosphatidylglycerol synthase domain-containing protein [Rhizobacter sp.]|nr:lysylphosphatidylglycerol synthase domain-containing protein [Rhizobacter sp.]
MTAAFFVLVASLLFVLARTIEWSAVLAAVGRYAPRTVLMAAALAACSFVVYATFDLIGRRYTGHPLTPRQVMTVGFISYVFNLNLGSLVGGFAFRYRLYARFGLDNRVITQVLGISLLTNWLGYLLLAGLVFCFSPLALPEKWKIDSPSLPLLGSALLGMALAYVLTCVCSRRRVIRLRSCEQRLPSGRMALWQLAVSSTNWLLMAGVVYTLLQRRIDYPTVLGVLLIGAVAGVIAHVPAGLGVLEAVFVSLLSPRLPSVELLAALLAYRGLYYLGPLIVATLMLIGVELRFKKSGAAAPARRRVPRHRRTQHKVQPKA